MKISIRKFLKSPYLNLTAAIVLLVTAAYEVYLGMEEFHLGAEHGLFVFSVIQILKVVPDIAEAVHDLNEGIEARKQANL